MIGRLLIWRSRREVVRKRHWLAAMEALIHRASLEGYDVRGLSGRVSEARVALSAVEIELRLMSYAISSRRLASHRVEGTGILTSEALSEMGRRKFRTW